VTFYNCQIGKDVDNWAFQNILPKLDRFEDEINAMTAEQGGDWNMCASYDRLTGPVYIKLDEDKNMLADVLRDHFTLKSKAYNVYMVCELQAEPQISTPQKKDRKGKATEEEDRSKGKAKAKNKIEKEEDPYKRTYSTPRPIKKEQQQPPSEVSRSS
jgi:hypothetical protein